MNEDFSCMVGKKDFISWRDLKRLGFDQLVECSAWRDCFRGRVGNGESLGFWMSRWIGCEPLC